MGKRLLAGVLALGLLLGGCSVNRGNSVLSGRAGFTGVPGTAIMRVGKKTACFSGIEYHLISEKIL